MKEYEVSVPAAGHDFVVVNAENEESAIEEAMDVVTALNGGEFEIRRTLAGGDVITIRVLGK